MEPLDLTRHTPTEFEGKLLVLGGCNYVIGPLFRESSQGNSYILHNVVSRLSLHVVQIRNEYLRDPQAAREASQLKAEMTAKVRADMLRDKGEAPIGVMRAMDAASGTVELHEHPWQTDPQGDAIIRRATEHLEANRISAVLEELAPLLAANPNHTHALGTLAECFARAGDARQALSHIGRAIEIEPNFMRYRAHQMHHQLRARMPALALMALDLFRQDFPGERDVDLQGIHAHLLCGQPEQARELLVDAALPEEMRRELAVMLDAACEAAVGVRKTLHALDERSTAGNLVTPELLGILEHARSRFPTDPFLNANLGFALRRAGRLREATGLLVEAAGAMHNAWMSHCWINAGLCAVQLGDFASANVMIGMGMRLQGYSKRDLHPIDMPDMLDWIDHTHNLSVESRKHTGADILVDWMADPAPAVPPSAEVKELARLYELTSVTYSRNSPEPAPELSQPGMREAEKLLGPDSVLLGQPAPWWKRFMRR